MDRSVPLRTALPSRRTGRSPDADLLAKRALAPAAAPEREGAIPAVAVGEADARVTILHFHGGGYRLGSAAGWRAFADRLASATRARVIVPDYALAPENPFPAALHDAVAALSAVADGSSRLVLSGDSAGGGLALALATMLAPPTPLAGLILLSPWLDLTLSGASIERCAATDPLFSRAAAAASADDYLQGVAADDPLASPLLADLSTLPPVLLMTSADEILCDDALRLASRLAAERRRATLIVEPGVPHIWPVLSPDHAASRRAIGHIRCFVDELAATP